MAAATTQGSERALRRAYGAGLGLCVGLPLLLQALLPRLLPPGQNPEGEVLKQIGYTFTGLSFLLLVLGARRVRKALALAHQAAAVRSAPGREVLLTAFLFAGCAVFGCLYWSLGGWGVERHARTFLALSPAAFLLLVPRPSRWIARSGQSPA